MKVKLNNEGGPDEFWNEFLVSLSTASMFVANNLERRYMEITETERQILLRGLLYSIKMSNNLIKTHKDIALWIALEDFIGDKDFSFRIALTVPNACEYSRDASGILHLYSEDSAHRLLTRKRMSFYVQGRRSEFLKRDVI